MTSFLRQFLLATLAASLAPHSGRAQQLYHATFNPPQAKDRQRYGVAPLSELPREFRLCYWTGGDWSKPPTDAQIKAVAQLQVSGGTNPQKLSHQGAQWEPAAVPAGTPVLLNCEAWNDADIRDAVKRYAAAVGSAPDRIWTVYGLFYWLPYPAGQPADSWLAESQFNWTRNFEMRREQLKDVVDLMPAIMIEAYPYDPLDTCLRSWDFQVANLRRLYPNKKLAVITRGFKPDGKNEYLHLSPDETKKLASWARSRFDLIVVWGWRAWNLDYCRELVHPPGWDAEIK